MFKTKTKFAQGDKVFAKVRGYPPWPARIEGLADETPNKMRYHVYFYGTGETAVIKAEDVFAFVENKVKFGKPKKQKHFTEALLQIEAELSPEEVRKANELIEKQSSAKQAAAKQAVVKQATSEKAAELDTSATTNTEQTKTAAARRSSTSAKPAKQQPPPTQPSPATTPVPNIPKPKDKKRKAEDVLEDSEAKKLRSSTSVTVAEPDATTNKVSPEVMSRSGRKIKPKRFADFEEGAGEDGTKLTKIGKSKDEDKEDDPDEYIFAVINEGEKIKIPLKLNRPNCCDEKNAEVWDEMVFKYANSLKKRIESGEKINDIYELMNEWTSIKSFEFVKERSPEEDKQKFDFLQTESQLLEIDISIKSALNLQKAQPEACLTLLDNLNELKITPLMLKKHPELVHTIKKMRKYVGNIHRWNMSEEELETFKEGAGRIRIKSEHIYNKFKSLFLNPDLNNFWEFFNKEVERFQEKTRSMTLHQLFSIVQEPE